MRLRAITLFLLLPTWVWGQSELTGGQSAKPRVMVIFDNSRSMEARPDNDFDSQFFADDLDPASLTGGVCSPSQPPASCRNKFCIGKCVMHNVLDAYDSMLEVGFASYYHYLRKTVSTVWATAPRTQCRYDVLAGMGEPMGTFWSLESNLGQEGLCTLSNVDSVAHKNSDVSAWGTALACRASSQVPEPAKICVPQDSSGWLFHSMLEHIRFSPAMPPPPEGSVVDATNSLPPLHPYQTDFGPTGYTENTVSTYTFSQFGPSNGLTYHLYEMRKDSIDVPGDRTQGCELGREQHFWSSPGPSQWSDCTVDNPCWAKLSGQYTVDDFQTFNSDQGPQVGDYVFVRTEGPFTVSTQAGSTSSLECPGGVRVEDPSSGTLYNTSETYITSATPGPLEVEGVVYTYFGENKQTATQTLPGNTSAACSDTFQGLPLKTATPVPTEPPEIQCDYESTTYTLMATSSTPRPPGDTTYHCEYQQTSYIYKRSSPMCVWERTRYVWRPKKWKYLWKTAGGEIVEDVTVVAHEGTNWCEPSLGYSAELAQACPAASTTIHPACGLGGRSCRLRWRASPTPYVQGRVNNFVGGSANTSGPVYCRATDFQESPISAPHSGLTQPQWCGYTQQPQNLSFEDVHVMSDPYSPTVNSNNYGIAVNSPYVLGGTVQSVAYSLDGVSWSSHPPLPTKVAGWSRTPMSLTQPGTSAMSFLAPGPNNLDTFRRIMEKYDAEKNPLGLRMPTRKMLNRSTGNVVNVTGHNTPLYGTLLNARDYFVNEVMPQDPSLACRTYAVILLTDGDENQLAPQPHHPGQNQFNSYTLPDLVSAVTGLRHASFNGKKPPDGVKTFVMGFGNSSWSANLNAMAVAAGTDVSGKAYNVTSPFDLQMQLQQIFNSLTSNRYTRSKPVVTLSGDRMYVAAFRTDGSREWKGELAAYNINSLGVNDTPLWEFQDKLNAQSAGLRKVYTTTKSSGQVNVNNLSGAQALSVYDAMGVNSQVGAEVMNFVLNPQHNAPFVGEPAHLKQSRVSAIFHSSPVLVGAPPFPSAWAGPDRFDMNGYEEFRQSMAQRPERLFVASNTGMVHALCDKTSSLNSPTCGASNENAGAEVYAFIPQSVLPELNGTRLGHKFTVDGSFGAADVCLKESCDSAEKWMTLLVGSMHKGGNRIFAADVTTDENFKMLWEFSDARLGETWSPPTVARVKVTSDSSNPRPWVGILGGGYQNPLNDRSDVSNSVLVVDLRLGKTVEDNSPGPERLAQFRVDQNPPSCAQNASSCVLPRNSVPGRIAMVRDNASAFVNHAFFGDTQGRMWSMDLRAPKVATWQPALMFDPSRLECSIDQFGNKLPIYDVEAEPSLGIKPVDALPLAQVGDPRPIFQRLVVSKDADGRALAFAGTGDELDPTWVGKDSSDKSYDHLYAVRYGGVGSVCSGRPLWVKRLRRGEKVLSEGTVGQSVVFVPTYMPPQSNSNMDACANRGSARIYAFYQSTGGPAKVFDPDQNALTPNNTHVLDLPSDGIISDLAFVVDTQDRSKGTLVYATDSGEPRAKKLSGLSTPRSVLGWRRTY